MSHASGPHEAVLCFRQLSLLGLQAKIIHRALIRSSDWDSAAGLRPRVQLRHWSAPIILSSAARNELCMLTEATEYHVFGLFIPRDNLRRP